MKSVNESNRQAHESSPTTPQLTRSFCALPRRLRTVGGAIRLILTLLSENRFSRKSNVQPRESFGFIGLVARNSFDDRKMLSK